MVHGGDVLFRSQGAAAAGADGLRAADGGRRRGACRWSWCPATTSARPFPTRCSPSHPGIHILDHPRTVRLRARRARASRWPGSPSSATTSAGASRSSWKRPAGAQRPADVRLLCLHQTVEGARVGPVGYTFRRGADVIRGRDLPAGFAAVLAGHIHRRQVLTADLAGRPLAAPVLYPGSIERTSVAERDEPKGYMTLEIAPGPTAASSVAGPSTRCRPGRWSTSTSTPRVSADPSSRRACGGSSAGSTPTPWCGCGSAASRGGRRGSCSARPRCAPWRRRQ